ncbi:uncharacterized protein LOC108997024 [Juglans regia]|uniref:Uncharacterized protein LOC108997024 n=1 Tax=Juglans regia TaxID=51240 RepID=A0A2I4FAH6_JUGRE|nr:uncharacterized protein LOC108997024 [Juglans regia]
MHLWPSMRIRDSFKLGYLRKLEWNLNRMESEKQKLLDNEEPVSDRQEAAKPNSEILGGLLVVCRESLMVLSCCYCCFCCGACLDEDEY